MVKKMKNQELITNKKPLDLQIKNGIKYFPVFVVLCIFAFLLLAPLVWMCLGSFKSDTEVMQYPPKFFPQANHLLENWKTVLTRIDFLTLTKNTVIYAVEQATRQALETYPGLPVLCSGGVASNARFRRKMRDGFDVCFARPEFSTDNAMGIAVLAAARLLGGIPKWTNG